MEFHLEAPDSWPMSIFAFQHQMSKNIVFVSIKYLHHTKICHLLILVAVCQIKRFMASKQLLLVLSFSLYFKLTIWYCLIAGESLYVHMKDCSEVVKCSKKLDKKQAIKRRLEKLNSNIAAVLPQHYHSTTTNPKPPNYST